MFYLHGERDFENLYIKMQNIIKKKKLDNMKFHRKFKEKGKQGISGLLNIDNSSIVFKMSQQLNYLVNHEYNIMKSLNNVRKYCPHFCKVYGKVKHSVDGNYRKKENPFDVTSTHPIQIDTLVMEYVKGKKLYSMLKNNDIDEKIIFSAIKQILLCLSIIQREKEFSHYDLHSCNIIMKKCNPDAVFLYVLDENNQFCVPTYGYYPVIIDFGFSYIKECNNKPICTSLAHTEVGFLSNMFYKISDYKLFLITVSDELNKYKNSKNTVKFRNIIRNIFDSLDVDWESGWDNSDQKNAADQILHKINNIELDSTLFTKYNHFCIDIIQNLITLPLKKENNKLIKESYKMFVEEFIKIEKYLTNDFYKLYVFKTVVEAVKDVKDDYTTIELRENAINNFKNRIYNSIKDIAKFCYPKNINFEKLLCGLISFSQASEGVLHKAIDKKISELNDTQLPTDMEEISGILEVNIPSHYEFNKNSKVYVWNYHKKNRDVFIVSKDLIKRLNDNHPILRGSILYQNYIKENFESSSEDESDI